MLTYAHSGGGTLAASGNELWVAAPVHVDDDPIRRQRVRMDRPPGRTSKPKLRLTQVYGDQPSQIAVVPAGVWVSGGRTVRRVDAATGEVVGVVRLPAYLGAVAVGGNAVWVDEPSTGRLIEIDPRTRKVRGSVSIGPSTARSSLAVVGPVVWAATNDGVVSVDQRSRQVTATLRIARAT